MRKEEHRPRIPFEALSHVVRMRVLQEFAHATEHCRREQQAPRKGELNLMPTTAVMLDWIITSHRD